MSQENVDVVRAIFSAWKERDAQAALRLIDPMVEVDLTGMSFPGEAISGSGHEVLGKAVASWLEAWESLELVPEVFIDAGDDVVVCVRLAAHGHQSGIPTGGLMAAVYAVRSGLVVRLRIYDTLAAAATAAGI